MPRVFCPPTEAVASLPATRRARCSSSTVASGRGASLSPLLVLLLGPPRHVFAKTIWEVGLKQGPIDTYEALPDPREFHRKFLLDEDGPFKAAGRPALFRGVAKAMPAYKLWTDKYLREKHGKVVMDQVETEKKETRSVLPHEGWTLKKFLDHYNTSDIYSTASTPKGLADEVFLVPSMNCGGFLRRLDATVTWFSSGGTKSAIHNDGNQNFHCVFDGVKDWALWHPEEPINTRELGWVQGEVEAKTDPKFKDTYGTFAGLIDPDNVDLDKFPKWDKLKWWSLHMEPGDCAYIPSGWFHFVESPRVRTVTVHVWFRSGKFDHKSCNDLEAKGYNLTDFLFRISDCTWGQKKTKCRLRKPLKKASEEL